MTTVRQMVPVVYRLTDPALHGAAARSLLATVAMLAESGVVECDGEPGLDSGLRYLGPQGGIVECFQSVRSSLLVSMFQKNASVQAGRGVLKHDACGDEPEHRLDGEVVSSFAALFFEHFHAACSG